MSGVRASAPGKLMLMGEHAVLDGYHCLVAAVNRRITVTLTPRTDRGIRIESQLGQVETSLDSLAIELPFTFVLQAIKNIAPSTGFDITVDSEFDDQLGLGSSAAVTVATTTALLPLADPRRVFDLAYRTILDVQGAGSGADVAASVWGGVLAYRCDPFECRKLKHVPPIIAVYSGGKEKTVDVIALVRDKIRRDPELGDDLFGAIDRTVRNATTVIERADWTAFGEMMNVNQGLMDALGVNNKQLSLIVYNLRNDPGIFGSKISGSGLGDCVIGLGRIESPDCPHEVLDLAITEEGVTVETLD